MGFTNRTHKGLQDSLFGKSSAFGALATAPTIYVGLSTTTPTRAGGNVTEPSGGAYARVETSAADWGSATDADPSVIANAEVVEFPEATSTWASGANMTHFVLFDAASDGNVIGYGALDVPKPVNENDTASFAAGDLEMEVGSPA